MFTNVENSHSYTTQAAIIVLDDTGSVTISSERFFDKLSDNSFDCSFFVSSSIDLFACLLVSFPVRLSIVPAVCLFVYLSVTILFVCQQFQQ